MGLLEVITGRRKLKGPAPDRLFAITTATVTLESEHGIEPAGAAAVVFQALSTSEFDATLADMEQVVAATGTEMGSKLSSTDDAYGFRWMVLRAGGVDDLAVGINAVSSSMQSAGYGERLLCAVFAFTDRHKAPIYFIYNYKRGTWYPFVPIGGATAGSRAGERSVERELQLKAQLGTDLPIEPELERWFPLWGIPI